ncbi:MAG: ABC transporter substrate-binding protein [Rhodobacteraceae bacterium]|nr:ABC transporter substrate-binding protein [Paracoccaceae bacterium]
MAFRKTSAALVALLAGTSLAQAEDCGTVTIAEMNWASAGLAAWVDKLILESAYGCEVELVTGDTMPTFTSMNERGDPDMAPELWVNAVRDPLARATEEGRLIVASEILVDGGVEGFWVPTWLAEQENLVTIEDALARPDLFPGAQDRSMGAFFNCPSGWACQLITGNQFAALGGEDTGFELVDSGSAAGLDGSIERAFLREQGWLGYYWAPTAILGRYPMTRLDLGVEHDADHWHSCTVIADCADPQLNEWPRSDVFTVVTERFAEEASVAMEYVQNRQWSNDVVNAMLAWMGENQATNEDGAYHFLMNHEEIWAEWLPAEMVARVRESL